MADTDDELDLVELNLAPNEASGLLRVEHQPLLDGHGWDLGFWVVLDEALQAWHVLALGLALGGIAIAEWSGRRVAAKAVGAA